MKKTTHGGRRPGAGRPLLFGEPALKVSVPESAATAVAEAFVGYRFRREVAALGLKRAALAPTEVLLPLMLVKVAAGFPSPADDYLEEQLDFNKLLVRNAPATFIYRLEPDADSMNAAGIFGGNAIVVDRSINARSGHIVLAILLGEGATVKRLRVRGSSIQLVPESYNPRHKPRQLREGEELQIVGVVTSTIQQFRV